MCDLSLGGRRAAHPFLSHGAVSAQVQWTNGFKFCEAGARAPSCHSLRFFSSCFSSCFVNINLKLWLFHFEGAGPASSHLGRRRSTEGSASTGLEAAGPRQRECCPGPASAWGRAFRRRTRVCFSRRHLPASSPRKPPFSPGSVQPGAGGAWQPVPPPSPQRPRDADGGQQPRRGPCIWLSSTCCFCRCLQ